MLRTTLLLALLAPASALANAITLDATTKTLEVTTSSSASTDYVVSYVDATTTAYTPGTSQGNIASATTTTVLSAPGASTQRAVSLLTLTNMSTTATQTVLVKLDVSGTEYALGPTVPLLPGESARLDNEGRLSVLTTAGVTKAQPYVGGFSGVNLSWYKVGATSEAAALHYAHAKDSGSIGAWIPGTPGVGGAVTDCSSSAGATVAGSPLLPNPASGSLFLDYGAVASTVAHSQVLYDLLWYDTGIAVTTTTSQSITTPTWPARDAWGSANGEGLIVALYVTTATTNASAVTNTTLAYKDQDNNDATATISSFPATAVAGALIPFQLAAGDRGLRAITGITLGTSYGGGAVSLVVLRPLWRAPVTVVNVGTAYVPPSSPGVRLYNGTCLWLGYLASATTATTTTADFWVVER